MKKAFAVILSVLFACAVPLSAQAPGTALHYAAGTYVASAYNTWHATVETAPSGTGSGTIVVGPAFVTLQDGYTFNPFSTANPVIVGQGTANQETVTPSAVSVQACPPGFGATTPCEAITATFSNTHGQGDLVVSGSSGVDEALFDAGNYGGGQVYWSADGGDVTLGTGATTTTLCTSCIPINAIVLGVTARVTTTITGTCTGWELGDGTTAGRFTANNTGLTAGTVSAADIQTTSGVASTTTGMLNITTAKNIVSTCATGNPSAGAIHAHAWGYVLATPNN